MKGKKAKQNFGQLADTTLYPYHYALRSPTHPTLLPTIQVVDIGRPVQTPLSPHYADPSAHWPKPHTGRHNEAHNALLCPPTSPTRHTGTVRRARSIPFFSTTESHSRLPSLSIPGSGLFRRGSASRAHGHSYTLPYSKQSDFKSVTPFLAAELPKASSIPNDTRALNPPSALSDRGSRLGSTRSSTRRSNLAFALAF